MFLSSRGRKSPIQQLACALILSLPNIACAGSSSECIVVEEVGSQHSPPKGMDEIQSKLWDADKGHRLVNGSDRYLVIRTYESDDGTADAQTYTKITAPLRVHDLLTSAPWTLNEGRFSKGNSGYAYRGDVWQADQIKLIVTPLHKSHSSVSIKGTIQAFNAMRDSYHVFDVGLQCEVVRRSMDLLTPWQGGPGDGWQYFYPQMTDANDIEGPR